MAYSKRIPPIKLVLTVKEYNILIGILTKNLDGQVEQSTKELAKLTKEKLLKYSLPRQNEDDGIEIDIRLYINEAVDIISQLLSYLNNKISEINYYQVLLKVRENIENIIDNE